jgi:DNA-binding NtrC family response regulator
MSKHVLLVEPYPDIAETLRDLLTDAQCQVDVAMSPYEMERALNTGQYDCVLLNLDQNRGQDFGLELAEKAAARGARIIMIPDHKTDRAIIAAKGWLQLSKPFTLVDVIAMIAQALGPGGEAPAVLDRIERTATEKDATDASVAGSPPMPAQA